MLPLVGHFKLNFDGVSNGNLGSLGFDGAIRNLDGEIMWVYHGFIGHKTKNAVEMEVLLSILLELLRSMDKTEQFWRYIQTSSSRWRRGYIMDKGLQRWMTIGN